jgi:ABC-type uncharacterized transport system permease subunit
MVPAFAAPALLYLAAWRMDERRAVPWLIAALALHAGSLLLATLTAEGWNFGFAFVLSATLWIGVAVMWFEGLTVGLRALRTLLLPAAAIAALLPFFFPGAELPQAARRPLFAPHLIAGTLAYGVLTLAALHALLMAVAERSLHGRRPSPGKWGANLVDELPPLLALERILFRLIAIGFACLTVTAASGIFFSELVFGRPLTLNHKIVFTLVSWAVFGALLLGRRIWGWRGRTALRLTLGGFVLLLLGYVGSHFVLEVVLGRR